MSDITKWNKAKLTMAIAELAYPNDHVIKIAINKGKSHEIHVNPSNETILSCGASGLYMFRVDYLNNFNDLMPLMFEHDVYYPISSKANPREMCEALYTVLLAKSEEG